MRLTIYDNDEGVTISLLDPLLFQNTVLNQALKTVGITFNYHFLGVCIKYIDTMIYSKSPPFVLENYAIYKGKLKLHRLYLDFCLKFFMNFQKYA